MRPLQAVSAQQAVVDALRDRILDGEFEPGAPLSDVALASDYGVARPTARAAVQALVHEGLMRREPRRRAYVPRLEPSDVRDLFFVRIPLELAAVDALVGNHEVLQASAISHFEQLDAISSWHDAVNADMAFHRAVISSAGSPRLVRAYSSLEAEIQLALVQLRPAYDSVAALAKEHRALIEVIASGSKGEARRQMAEHLERAVSDLVEQAGA